MGSLVDTLKRIAENKQRQSPDNERNEINERTQEPMPRFDLVDDLLALYEERAAIRQFDGGYSKPEAERLAWGEVAALWHRQHGERVPAALCAGCGKPISGQAVQLLPHGERAHADGDYRCIRSYGRRWKTAAAEALEAMGVPTPHVTMEDSL
jgi:hypothetical protein